MLSPPHLTGKTLTPEHPAYDEARAVFAAHVDRRPSLIARVAGPDDVARVIAHARETGAELAVRGGGHSPAGHGVSDGGVVIDLSALRSFELDPPAARPGPARASPRASSPPRRARTGSRPGSATRARSASAGSRSPAASASSCASTG